jgi:hypothetical protein
MPAYWSEVQGADIEELASKMVTALNRQHSTDPSKTLQWAPQRNACEFYPRVKQQLVLGYLSQERDQTHDAVPMPGMGAQAVTKRKGDDKEYVFDQAGQLTPRYAYRFISADDETTLKNKQGLKPKDASAKDDVYAHVAGVEKTHFISTTRSSAVVVTPTGAAFGTKRVTIDLSLVSRQCLYDVGTPQGEREILKGKDPDVRKHSNKVQQALKDAKRTREVLIEGAIPQEAIVETAYFDLPGVPRHDYDQTRTKLH